MVRALVKSVTPPTIPKTLSIPREANQLSNELSNGQFLIFGSDSLVDDKGDDEREAKSKELYKLNQSSDSSHIPVFEAMKR